MNREQAIALAKKHLRNHIPDANHPHEWTIEAILEAANLLLSDDLIEKSIDPATLKLTDITKPVMTRNGRKARYLGTLEGVPVVHVFAIASGRGEYTINVFSDGRYIESENRADDIVNVPEEPKTGEVWVNVYGEASYTCHQDKLTAERGSRSATTGKELAIARVRVPFPYRNGQFDE